MAAQLSELRTRIQARGYSTDTAATQTALINSVIRRIYGMRRWPWLENLSSSGGALTIGNPDKSLSAITDLLHVDAIRLDDSGKGIDLRYMRVQDLQRNLRLDDTNGQPQFWTRTKTGIKVYPTPDKAYTVYVDYVPKPTALAADGDLSPLPDVYDDAIVWGVIKELTFRERDYNGRQWALDEYQTILMDMINEYNLRQRQNSSEVVSSGYWQQAEELELQGDDVWVP